MKAFLICVLLGLLQVNSAPLNIEQKEKLRAYHDDCVKQTNVSEALIEKACQGTYIDDPSFKNFLFCFSQRIGFQDDLGVVQKDVFRTKVSNVVEDEAVLSKLVDQCTVQKESPEDTSFNIAKCLREVAPGIEFFKVAPEKVYLSNEQTQGFFIQHKECIAQDKLDKEVIEDARKKGVLFEDLKFKDYIYCFSKKQGFQNEDGVINKDKFYKCFGKYIEDPAVLEKLAQKCIVQQDTPEDTAFLMSKCIYDNSPVHVELFPRDIAVPDEVAKKIRENHRACIKETGVDRELVLKTRDGVFPDDPKFKEFTFCVYKKAEFLNDSGDFQIDIMRKKILRLFKDSVVVQKLIDQCAVKQGTPQETAFKAKICLYKNSPGHISVTQFGALSEAQQKKRNQAIKECSEEIGVSKSTVSAAHNGDFQDDPLLKQYFFCLNKKCGAVNEAGEFTQDFVKKGLTELFNAEEAERIIEKCYKSLDTSENTSFESFKCFYKNAPEEVKVF